MNPKVSVVIPAYNEEKEIGNCLDGVLSQTVDKSLYEVLVIDNNSTDKTSEIAKERGVKVIPYTEKQGITVTKQFGSMHAKGDILAYVDADSRPTNTWIESGMKLFQNEKLQIVGGLVYPNQATLITEILFILFNGFAWCNQKMGISLLWGGNMMIRRSAYDKINGFNTNLHIGEDWEIARRVHDTFGKGSALYTNQLVVFASPRKQENPKAFLIYLYHGFLNYINLYILKKSHTVGKPITIR